MSRELRIALVAIVGVVALFFTVSSILPSSWQVESRVLLPVAPAKVLPLLADFGAWQQWATLEGTMRADTKARIEGAPGTVGHQLVWDSNQRQAALVLTAVRDDGVEYDFRTRLGGEGELVAMGHGTLRVSADGERSSLVWRDEGRAEAFTERWFAWFGAQQEAARKFQEASLARLRVRLEGK
jgi:hypothetical protein